MIIQYFPHTLKNPIRPTIHTHLLHLWAVVFTITVITHLWLHRSVRKWEQQWLLPPTDHCHTKNTRSLRPMPTDKTGWKKKKFKKKARTVTFPSISCTTATQPETIFSNIPGCKSSMRYNERSCSLLPPFLLGMQRHGRACSSTTC